jgi:hypothetical protein
VGGGQRGIALTTINLLTKDVNVDNKDKAIRRFEAYSADLRTMADKCKQLAEDVYDDDYTPGFAHMVGLQLETISKLFKKDVIDFEDGGSDAVGKTSVQTARGES